MADPKSAAPTKPEVKPEAEKLLAVDVGPLKVKPVRPAVEAKQEELGRVWVWYGSKPDCPFENFGVGGICFAREVYKIRPGAHGSPDQVVPEDGNYHQLTKMRVREVMECVAKLVFRMEGGRVTVYDVTKDDYWHDPSDKPVGKCLYMVIVEEGKPFDRSRQMAPTMV
jgi:hypothetical protein